MSKPSVAIVITAFNHAPYIEQALISALNQASSEYNLMVIAVDDHSRDNTLSVLKNLKKVYDFEIIAQPKNFGPSASRNAGIKAAKTDYISFLDGDDYLLGGKVALQLKAMKTKPDIAVCYTDCLIERNGFIDQEPLSKQWPPADGLIYTHLLLRNCIASHAVLMKTSVARKYLFDEKLSGPEDYEFWLRLALKNEKYLYLDKPCVVYRRISASLSTPSQPIFDKVLEVLDMYEPHIKTDEQRRNINHHRSIILQNKADLCLQKFDNSGVEMLAVAYQLEMIPKYKVYSLRIMRRFFPLGALAYKLLDLRSRLRAQHEQKRLLGKRAKSRLCIGVDVRALQSPHRFRGIGHFVSNFLSAISAQDDKNIYTLYTEKGEPLLLPELNSSFRYFIKPVDRPRVGLNWLMDSYRATKSMAWTAGADIFFQPDIGGGLAPRKIKSIVMLHDLIPLLFKKQYLPRWTLGFSGASLRQSKRALGAHLIFKRQLSMYRKAWRVLAISESTRRDALERLPGLKPIQVKVVHLAANTQNNKAGSASVPEVKKKFILYIGSIDYRKNVSSLIRAFNEVRDRGENIQLVLAGNDFMLPDAVSPQAKELRAQITASRYSRDIILPGYVSNEQRNWLYEHAQCFVFTSLYEGFGLPVLEAMAAGCPVIALSNSSIPEIAGEAALLLQSADDIPDAIIDLINNPTIVKELKRLGAEQVQNFSWEGTAREIVETINEAAK